MLGSSPQIRSAGSVLRLPVRDPASHLRDRLHDAHAVCAGAVIEPDDLWLVNAVDPQHFLDDLASDGVQLLVLVRHSTLDRGLSRTLCGRGPEVLPRHAIAVDASTVAVHALHAQRAHDWFDTAVPHAPRLIFEDDVVAGTGVVERMTTTFGVDPWTPPPLRRAPTHDRLWNRVADPDRLRAELDALKPVFESA